ncbi:hypothetical protein LT493_11610 [Streptomyces tricolor]|nr:hypothetical protein [Streptomyces tricolor]
MRVVMYWRNGRSLGHTAESAKVAHGLAGSGQEFHLSGLTGAYRGLDLLPSAMDVVKLPAFTNYDNVAGWATRGRAATAAGPLFHMRAEMAGCSCGTTSPTFFSSTTCPRARRTSWPRR